MILQSKPVQPLRAQVGSLFIVGVENQSLSKLESAWFRLLQPAGVILFRRNIGDAAQTHALLSSCAHLLDANPFRCVDLEGGTVDRLRDAIAPIPAAGAVAATGRVRDARTHGEIIAAEARIAGFNTVLAPVLDLALPACREVMQSRVVSADPARVIAYAQQFLKGLATKNVLACGKHFPGLGGGTLDSHHAMPNIERDWQQTWNEDLAPYRALRRDLPMIMVNHAAYPRIPNAASSPASISPFWIESVLRKKIGYRGLLISDDMEMGGILSQFEIECACIQAIAAGTDLLEICHQPALVLRGYEAVLQEAEHSSAFRKRVTAAAMRVAAAKRSHLREDSLGDAPTLTAVAKVKRTVERFTSEIMKAQPQ